MLHVQSVFLSRWVPILSLLTLLAPSVSQAEGFGVRVKRLGHAVARSPLGKTTKRWAASARHSPLGQALEQLGRQTGRAIKEGEAALSGHITLLADEVERRLPPAEAFSFHHFRLANPLTAAGFVGGKIKDDWNPLWMWLPVSLTLSNGMHYWLMESAGFGLGTSTLIRVPVGIAIDLAAIGAYNHYRRKQNNPGQTLRQTGRELKAEYLQHAYARRARNRARMGETEKKVELNPRVVNYLAKRYGVQEKGDVVRDPFEPTPREQDPFHLKAMGAKQDAPTEDAR